MISWCYLAAGADVAVTGRAGAHLLQLPRLGVGVAAALPVGAVLGLALAGPLHHLQNRVVVDSCCLADLRSFNITQKYYKKI